MEINQHNPVLNQVEKEVNWKTGGILKNLFCSIWFDQVIDGQYLRWNNSTGI